jgi:hypothetical protein
LLVLKKKTRRTSEEENSPKTQTTRVWHHLGSLSLSLPSSSPFTHLPNPHSQRVVLFVVGVVGVVAVVHVAVFVVVDKGKMSR